MKPTVIARHAYDPADPVDRGVEADEMAGYTCAYMRRIVCRDPAGGERFVFLTTEDSLRPGVIALLYLRRRKIEKVFDVFKNKLHRQKARANGGTAAATQVHLTALAHNLLTLLLVALEQAGQGEKKFACAAALRRECVPAQQRVPAQEMVRHGAQLTCRFIRLVRHRLDYRVPWHAALPLFQRRLDSYP